MDQIFVLILAGFTSLGAVWVGTKWIGLPGGTIRRAMGRMLECVGLTLVFLAVNIGVGTVAILATRTATGRFIPLYLAADNTLPMLSLLQALIFRWWLEHSTS